MKVVVVAVVFAALATAEAAALVLGLAGVVLSSIAIWRTIVLGRDLREVTQQQTTATTSLTERAELLDRQMLGDGGHD